MKYHTSMKMEQIECFETSAYKIQTPGNYPKENIKYKKSVTLLSRSVCYFTLFEEAASPDHRKPLSILQTLQHFPIL